MYTAGNIVAINLTINDNVCGYDDPACDMLKAMANGQ